MSRRGSIPKRAIRARCLDSNEVGEPVGAVVGLLVVPDLAAMVGRWWASWSPILVAFSRDAVLVAVFVPIIIIATTIIVVIPFVIRSN